MKKLSCILVAILAIFTASTFVSCDKDDVSKFTVLVAEHLWTDSEGRIYEFYKYYSGVMYENESDYKSHRISRSFVWSKTEGELSIGINGYRNDDGEMVQLDGDEIKITTYSIAAFTKDRIELKSDGSTLVLASYTL